MMRTHRYLTKSRYLAGLQCHKRLWMHVHDPIPEDERETSPMMEWGTLVGEKARSLFPNGVLVEAKPWGRSNAVARTAELMADRNIPAIFEAAFEARGVHVRVDILERLKTGWGIREVKISTKVKDEHLDDIAIQSYVLRAAGISVPSAQLWLADRKYERGTAGIDWKKYFLKKNVTKKIQSRLEGVLERLKALKAVVARQKVPAVEPDAHCSQPYKCEFWERCTEGKSQDWVFHLPRVTGKQLAKLAARQIDRISRIPADFPLSRTQEPIVTAHRTKKPHISKELAVTLKSVDGSACYLDFEAMRSPVPAYPGTRPYQRVPFQWSLHVRDAYNSISHRGFLGDAERDPRRDLVDSLLDVLGRTKGPIIVYSGYEGSVLTDLKSKASRSLAREIDAAIGRITDLLPIVRRSLYLPEFSFSYSIKSVAPALSPNFTYDDLDQIADGDAASNTFALMAQGIISDRQEVARLRAELERYCERDTRAMVEVHDALRKLAEGVV